MNRAEKAAFIEQLREKAESASIAIVTDFQGLKVEELTQMRVKLREGGNDYQVVKNTLASIAFTDGRHAELGGQFKNSCGVAFGYEDPVSTAKALVDFAKTSKKFSIRFGSLEGKAIDASGVEALAKMPSKPELLAKTLGTMNAVPTNFVCLFANLLRNTLYCLTAIKDQKEEQSA